LVQNHPADAERTRAVIRFFDFAYREGKLAFAASGTAPLPEGVAASVRADWRADLRTKSGDPLIGPK